MSQNPYSAPIEKSSPQTSPEMVRNRGGYQYKPLNTLAKILLVSVGLICFGNLVVSTMEVIGQMLFPGFSDPNAPLSSDLEQYFLFGIAGVGILSLPTFILAAVVTAMYFYRANANLHSLGVRGLQHTPGWCAGYWFIPIINLIKPYQVAGEINTFSRLPSHETPNASVGLWWTFWIIGNIVSNIESRLALSGADMGSTGLVLSWASTLLTCAAGFLFIKLVFAFASAQEELRNVST